MNNEWIRFTASLEGRGVTFEQVQFASDRQAVIQAAGFADPLGIAIVETEWRKRVGPSGVDGLGGGPMPFAAAGTLRSGMPSLGLPKEGPSSTTLLLHDETRLEGIPEEMQDAVLASEVLSAAVGCGGALIQPGKSGFTVSSRVPPAMNSLCQTILPVADAFVALQDVGAAEYAGRSLVAMALGEIVSEVCTSYAHQVAKLHRWAMEKMMPLMGVVSEILRVGHHIIRLRQVLPTDLLLQSESGASNPRLLNHLYEQAEKHAGSSEDDGLLDLLLRRSLMPYLRMLHRWMHEGVLEDPFGEFFITETFDSTKPAPTAAINVHRRNISALFPEVTTGSEYYSMGVSQHDVVAFENRFLMNRLLIPAFLEKPSRVAKMIFFTGKYCCLLREYNETLPSFGGAAEHMLVWSGVDELQRTIQESYEIASVAIIQLLFSPSVDLLGHLSSMKMYFMQERSDWVVHFLDSAEELLTKSLDKVKVHSIRVLLQASIARCCATDPYHSLISCSFSDSVLERFLQRLGGPEEGASGQAGRLSSTSIESRRCIELLQLEVDLQWPLTLVLDATIVRRFNVIFRLLTWLKVCERNLCSLWHTNEVLAGFSTAYGIKHQFIQFLRQFQFYAAHFVLEPLWSRMVTRIGQSDSVFGISQALQDFFEGVEMGLVLSSANRFRSLSEILVLTARFCDIGRHSSTATLPLIESALHSLEDQFLQALSELASPVGHDYPQLIPLLTWIDFSAFYDRNNVYRVQRGSASVGD